jgi:hypothetical protein
MQLLRPRVLAAVLAMTAALASVMLVSAPAASAAPPTSGITVPVTGANGINSFAGNFTLTGFRLVNGTLNAVGTLTGTITNIATGATTAVDQVINLPVAGTTTGTCQILHLVLGPLDLSLLGLNVHLDQVVLDITATSGPGDLLGNLLCSVAHLLDGSGGGLNGLTQLLNSILRQL